jgi:hypothetical protein
MLACLYVHCAWAWVPVEVMRLRVRHARERVGLCCVGLVRHGDGCVCEGGFGEERKKGAGTKVARLALQKLRLEILGLRSRVAQTGVAAPPGTAL